MFAKVKRAAECVDIQTAETRDNARSAGHPAKQGPDTQQQASADVLSIPTATSTPQKADMHCHYQEEQSSIMVPASPPPLQQQHADTSPTTTAQQRKRQPTPPHFRVTKPTKQQLRTDKRRTLRILLEVAEDVSAMGRRAACEIEEMARVYDANYESLKIEFGRLSDQCALLEVANAELKVGLEQKEAELRDVIDNAELRKAEVGAAAASGDDDALVQNGELRQEVLAWSSRFEQVQHRAQIAEAEVELLRTRLQTSKTKATMSSEQGSTSQSFADDSSSEKLQSWCVLKQATFNLMHENHALKVGRDILEHHLDERDAAYQGLQKYVDQLAVRTCVSHSAEHNVNNEFEALIQPFVEFEKAQAGRDLGEADKSQFYSLMLDLQRQILDIARRRVHA